MKVVLSKRRFYQFISALVLLFAIDRFMRAVPPKPCIHLKRLQHSNSAVGNVPAIATTYSVKRSPVIVAEIPVVRGDLDPTMIGGSLANKTARHSLACAGRVLDRYRVGVGAGCAGDADPG